MDTRFIAANSVDLETVVSIFNAGYEGYIIPVNVTTDWMTQNLKQNDTQLALSTIALVDDEPAGICLLAKRGTDGWINAIGITPPFRRQGIGRALMTHTFEVARANGIENLQLEFIIGNDNAQALYESLGFKITRKLLILVREPAEIDSTSPTPSDYDIQPADGDSCLQHYNAFHQIANPWQRAKPSLHVSSKDAVCWVATKDGEVQAYVMVRIIGENIIIMDAASAPTQLDALHALLIHLHTVNPQHTTRFVNLPDNDPSLSLFERLGYKETMAQYEMAIALSA